MLNGFLDWYREVVDHKVQGLSRDDATRTMTASGLSPLGTVRHLAYVERRWFQDTFAGADPVPAHGGAGRGAGVDPHAGFRVDPGDTVQSVLASYREAADRSRAVERSAATLDDLSASEHHVYGRVSLRWILVHMLEETARHAGHLDLMREQIDGTTGD
jgi:Protein of unknown function (DUF664)